MSAVVQAVALAIGYAVILASLLGGLILLGSLACEVAHGHLKHQVEFWQAYGRYKREKREGAA